MRVVQHLCTQDALSRHLSIFMVCYDSELSLSSEFLPAVAKM